MLERFGLVLFDFRKCGRNSFHAAEPHTYPRFARDNARDNAAVHPSIEDAWVAKTAIGVFHSKSATAALPVVIEGRCHWGDALVLFDPPLMPPPNHPLRGLLLAEGEMLRDAARMRQSRFFDPTELTEVLRTLHRFRRMRREVAELYARSTLRYVPAAGAWELCCPGLVEDGLNTVVAMLSIWQEIDPSAQPMLVVGLDPKPAGAPKTARCCAEFCEHHGIECANVPGNTHLLQVEQTGTVLHPVCWFPHGARDDRVNAPLATIRIPEQNWPPTRTSPWPDLIRPRRRFRFLLRRHPLARGHLNERLRGRLGPPERLGRHRSCGTVVTRRVQWLLRPHPRTHESTNQWYGRRPC